MLRCIAVLLVLILHANISSLFARFGWTGVDLFFVISGFLISGLLFSEYRTSGSISFRRFFIRRGLKIYPSFYIFLLLTLVGSQLAFHQIPTKAQLLHNALFVMNYTGPNDWDHLWSLGVEEHFYVFLPLLLLALARISTDQHNPFRTVPYLWGVIALSCVLFRALSVCLGAPNFHMAHAASHNRIDSLFFGVALGYLYHFKPKLLEGFTRPWVNCVIIAFLSVAALSSAYFVPRETRLFSIFGFSALYLGYGGLLLLTLYVRDIVPTIITGLVRRIGDGLAYVGKYSYSIYLWHGPANAWLPGFIRRILHVPVGGYSRFAIYFLGSLTIGILMSRTIEYPILRLRDQFFPAKQVIAVAPKAY
ncbi:MAG TPA: acyltransferase [Candidatus Dormibacteraeota bacterium]|nr:acyltransferase [Candidatus Dormibacteraeota bacterium]